MMSKAKIVVAAVLVLGLASAAQAGGRDDADPSGGYRVGPTGQSYDGVNPAIHRATRVESFAQSEAFGYAAVPHQPARKKAKSH
jgi:hypothetical protein